MLMEVIKDTALDSIKLLPFLYITYLLIELIEHKVRGGRQSKGSVQQKIGSNLGSIVWNHPSVWIFSGGFQLVCRKDHYHWYIDGSVSFYIRRDASDPDLIPL